MMDSYDLLILLGSNLIIAAAIINTSAPFLKAELLNRMNPRKLYGVAAIEYPGNAWQLHVLDHKDPKAGWLDKTKEAYLLGDNIGGNKRGVPISFHNSQDVTARYTWKSDGEEPVSTKFLDSCLRAAREVGEVDASADIQWIKKFLLITLVATVLGALGAVYLSYMGSQNASLAANAAQATYGQMSNLTALVLSKMGGGVIPGVLS